MEILNISNPTNFSIPTFCHPKTLTSKFTSNNIKPTSPFRRTSFSLYLSRSAAIKFQTWAHSGRPSNRRNSLRKKLLRDHKVNPNQIPNDPFSVSGNGVEESGVGVQGVSVVNNVVEAEKPKSKILRESVLWNKLENWVDQYKKDVEYWGVGSGPIFTVYEDSLGAVERVVVDEDQILKRSKVRRDAVENLAEVRSKILNAKNIAREMESGNNVIARNSSVAKFVVEGKEEGGGFVKAVQGFVAKPRLLPRLSWVGRKVLYVLVVVWVVKKLFVAFGERDKEVEYTATEKEMMRRKIKAREEKEKLTKRAVEVVVESSEAPVVDIKKPKLDKEQLRNSILKVTGSADKLVVHDSSDKVKTRSTEMDYKVQEIREMARQARKIEGSNGVVGNRDMETDDPVIEISSDDSEQYDGLSNHQNEVSKETTDSNTIMQSVSVDVPESIDNSVLHEEVPTHKGNLYALDAIVPGDREIKKQEIEFSENDVHLKDSENGKPSDTPINGSSMTNESSVKKKPRIIRSVKEARDYLSKKHDKQDPGTSTECKIELAKENIADMKSSSVIDLNGQKYQNLEKNTIVSKSDTLNGILDSKPLINSSDDSDQKDKEVSPRKNEYIKGSGIEPGLEELQKDETTLDQEVSGISTETRGSGKTENWLEKNFHEVEPIVKQIRAGFRNNYMAAKERVNQTLDIPTEMESLGGVEDDGELDWMQDDHLRDIVFRVRENELSGRDPFYLMNDEDKDTFFRGLEKKVEKENKKLSDIHEWLHSNIENLDYGADGISIYDPPEKIIPRWKGPPVEKIPEFLNEFLDEKKTSSTRNMNPVKKDESGFAITSADSSLQEKVDGSTAPIKKSKNPKTIIEGSDGSIKVGKKSGKEYWQHTKKWSQGFLDCYNDETDPEVKSIMKDMGKGLDRWITEKEIEEAAELMDKLPDRNRSFMEKKLNKIKREMELFGPQAVVSKYREYADDKEEDYLWWLDLSHVLCIELYTVENGEQKVGLYSLEMASDLELEPKPYHVIAFQDPNDCKNLCYIIQAHMEMLGNGHAFVVARPPKDAFREAKANGFGVTVIKKGELQLNIDQPLEEVEEQISEIGSKMYHDMMMKERSVDINTLMKGVFGFSDRSIKRLKRKLKKPRKG
ncbi:hypothetical protein AAZX31_16G022500 [Glycine max]